MAALALAVGAYLVQTRLPNAKCAIESSMGVAAKRHRFKNPVALRPSSIQAMRRGSQTPRRAALIGGEATYYSLRAGLRQEDPPNLNILLSGGKETNKDSLSNGE